MVDWPPSDDIGRKRKTPMNSTPAPKETEPRDAPTARADEQLVHAYEQIKLADEQLARVSEQLAKMERDDAHPASAGPGPQSPPTQSSPTQSSPMQSPPGKPALRILVGLPLAACIVVGALVLQSSYGGGVVARWAPQLVSAPSLPPENPPLPAQPAPSSVQVAAAEAAPPQAAPPQATPPQATPPQATPPQATSVAQTTPQEAAPTATAALPDHTQLLQTIVRDLANVERTIEQLKANQQQIATDNSKAIGELKASQEEMKRVLAKVSEQSPPKASSRAARPAPTLRKPERKPQARARPRFRREWIYDDW